MHEKKNGKEKKNKKESDREPKEYFQFYLYCFHKEKNERQNIGTEERKRM